MHKHEALARQQTADLIAQASQFIDNIYLPKEAIDQLRLIRLKKILAHAKRYSPWYKKSLAHIDIDTFTLDNIQELPILTKQIVMDNWDDIVTDRDLKLVDLHRHISRMQIDNHWLYLHKKYHVLSTGGSSGIRGIFIYDWNEWIEFYLYAIRLAIYKATKSPAPISKDITRIAQVGVTHSVYASRSFSKTFANNNDYLSRIDLSTAQPMSEIVHRLNTFQPHVLLGYPSVIHKLCLECQNNKLKITPHLISVFAEPLYKPVRKLIHTVWPDAKIRNIYACSEGLCGINCEDNTEYMHLNDDGCIIEPINAQYEAVPKGMLSDKLLLTNLYNYTFPIIRYEIHDQLIFSEEPCACGINHQLILEPQGRLEYDFSYSNGVYVHHLTFTTPLLHEGNIKEYQIQQTLNGADVRLLTIGKVDKLKLKSIYQDALSALGLKEPQINIIEVDAFEYPDSGKLRRFLKLS